MINVDLESYIRYKAVAKRLIKRAKQIEDMADEQLFNAIDSRVQDAYNKKKSDFGTVNIDAGEYTIKVDTPKTVKWDSDLLEKIFGEIANSGGDPDEYIKTELKVEEEKYKHFPEQVKKYFDKARTVKAGKKKVEVIKND